MHSNSSQNDKSTRSPAPEQPVWTPARAGLPNSSSAQGLDRRWDGVSRVVFSQPHALTVHRQQPARAHLLPPMYHWPDCSLSHPRLEGLPPSTRRSFCSDVALDLTERDRDSETWLRIRRMRHAGLLRGSTLMICGFRWSEALGVSSGPDPGRSSRSAWSREDRGTLVDMACGNIVKQPK